MTCNFIEDDIPCYHFTDDGFSCKIVPAFGGSIQELIIHDKPVIKGVSIDRAGFEEYTQFCNSAILFPFPNRVAGGAYTFGNKDFQLQVNDNKFGNAIHGFVYAECPEVISQTDTSITFRFNHTESTGYPFPYSLELKYQLSSEALKLEFKVRNNGLELMPFGLGWHPYFVTDEQQEFSLLFKTDKKYLVNESMIPDHSTPLTHSTLELFNLEVDNAYRLTDSEIVLKGNDRELKLVLPENSYVQLFSPSNRLSFAIEPMSCIPDAFNNKIGLKTLRPGQEFSWNVELEVSAKRS